MKKMTEKQKREARNKYSREWKKKNSKKVLRWNKAWRAKQKKANKNGRKAA